MTGKRLEDFENDGFKIYDEGEKPSPDKPNSPGETKIVVVDNKEVLHAVETTSMIVKQGIENSNRQLAASVARIVQAAGQKPDSFTLDIHRDQRGFMTSIDVKINK